MVMPDQSNPFTISIKRYLRFIPYIIIPLAGILYLMTVAPYYAVSKGCEAIEAGDRKKRRGLALNFALTMATALSMLIVLILYIIAPLFRFEGFEAIIIGLIYGSFIIFSLLGSRT